MLFLYIEFAIVLYNSTCQNGRLTVLIKRSVWKTILDAFGIHSSEICFEDQEGKRVVRHRGPAPIKYRTPTGIEWSGKGNMKKEFREYLLSEGLTEEDKDLFLVEEFKK